MAEQFALHELLGQSRAVHRDERGLRAGSQPVQFARHQFFARAAFSGDQDAAWNPRNTFNGGTERPHGHAVADKRRFSVEPRS